ncbi:MULTISPECIES: LysR family transcriptional regulator [Photobacterium]|uniref:LysR family transcriptional regulator n=2 Tax=Photobacterium piscicola TaxID=1378299 RepID=A0ABU6LCU9_9GAMM|nr:MULTISPECIES: LysR family transcriptional regulator [Photobacterium]MEC6881306.1 LysR family transcriptional regulator [Photobacterium piscicola]MEC6897175.1 LysR family transcriptional regulator [Photobacterium piscicola]
MLYTQRMNINNPKNLDRILLLTTWVRIVEAGSLSAAAKQLKTTQPTVSRRLQSLEQIFKCKLMLRTTHQLKLTDEGDTCYQHAKQLLEQWSILEDSVGSDTAKIKGRLRVRAPHAFGQQQLIKPLMEYLTLYPEMRIDWLLNDISPDFLADNIDCAIHVGAITNPNVVAKLIGYVPRIIVAAPKVIKKHGDIKNISELQQWPWIAVSTFYNHELILKNTLSNELSVLGLDPILSTDNLYSALECIKGGLGIGAISSWLVKPYLLTGQLVHMAEHWQADPLPIYFVYPYSNYYSKRLRLFMEVMTIGIQQMIGIDPNGDYSNL